MRVVVLVRHAHSQLNLENRVNGDPARPVALTDEGREEARLLGVQLASLPLDACIHTRFARTRETAEIALAGRDVPLEVEPLLDDIDVGALEGSTLEDYRAWKHAHTRDDPFPGGESLNAAARRYAEAYRGLLARRWQCVLVVCHEIPIRYAVNAAADSSELDRPVHDIPNARPVLFGADALAYAADRLEALAATT